MGSFDASFDARDGLWLAAFLVLFLGSRGLWIVTHPETASYWEEAYRWMAASDWLGAAAPTLSSVQADHYQGGSLVMIALAKPVLAFGDSLLSLKAPALLFSSATLILLYTLGRRFFGAGAARIAAAAYLAGPPLVAYLGVLSMGSHGESVAFSLAALWLFLRLLEGEPRSRSWLAFGLVNGLGIWFCPTVALTTLACVATWGLLRPPPRTAEWAAAAGGLVLGLAPWLAYNLAHDFAGLRRPLEVFGLRPLADPWLSPGVVEKATGLFRDALPGGWLDPASDLTPSLLRAFVLLGFSIPAVAAGVASLRRARAALRGWGQPARDPGQTAARLELVFLVYGAVLLATYLLSSYVIERGDTWSFRLFAPLGVIVLTPLSIGFARGLRDPARRKWAALGCGLWLLAIGTATFAFATRTPELVSELTPRAGDPLYGVLLHRKHGPELAASLAAIRSIPDPQRREAALTGLGLGIVRAYEVAGSLAELDATLAAVPLAERSVLHWGLLWGASNSVDALDRRASRVRIDESLVRRMRRLEELAAFARAASLREPKADLP